MNTIEFAAPAPRDRRRERVSLPTDRLWTVRQAAAFLGRSVSWVYKAAERGELPRARGMGWGLRFVPVELHAYARGDVSALSAMVRLRKGGA
jgi:predicted DNA-binding transcriptional regulator AlpA